MAGLSVLFIIWILQMPCVIAGEAASGGSFADDCLSATITNPLPEAIKPKVGFWGLHKKPLKTMALGCAMVMPLLLSGFIMFRWREKQGVIRQELLANVCEMGDISCFYCDYQGKQIECSRYENFWPRKEDGSPASHTEWVWSEDLPLFEESWKRVLEGVSFQENISYRVRSGEKFRYFEMQVRRSDAYGAEKRFFGLIRDVTLARERENSILETNLLLQEIVENLPCSIFVKDINDGGRYIISNRHNLNVLGLSPDQMVGKTDSEIFPPAVAESFIRGDQEVLEKGGVLNFLDHYVDREGRTRVFQLYKVVLPQKTDRRLLLGISVDMTEIEKNRSELKENVELLRSLMDNLPCHFFVKDADNDFRFLLGNDHFEGFFQKSAKEYIGKTGPEFFPSTEQAQKFRESDLLLLEKGGKTDLVSVVTSASGEERVFQIFKNLLTLNDGRRLILGIATDITEQEKNWKERQRLLHNLNKHIKQERMFTSCLESVVMNSSADESLRVLLQTVSQHIGADACYLSEYDFANSKVLPLIKYLDPEFDEIPFPRENNLLSENEPWHTLFNKRELFLVDQAQFLIEQKTRTGLTSFSDYLKVNEITSMGGVGLFQNNKLWGSLTFYFRKKEKKFTALDNRWLKVSAHLVEVVLDTRFKHHQLERSEYEKRLIMDTMDIPIQLFDANMKLIRINGAAQKLAGWPEEKILREPCYRNFCGSEARPNDCPTLLARQNLKKHHKSIQLKGADYVICSHPIFIEGKLSYILKTFVDVSESSRAQEKLTRALLKAQEASKAKSYFLATMSHEIRTPLNAVIGFSDLLKKEKCSEDDKLKYLESIHLAANALLNLINDILDLSTIEAGAVPLVLRYVNLSEIIREIQSIFQYQTRVKGLEVMVEFKPDIPFLKLDQLRFRQILLNLVGNAVKFTEKGSVKIITEFTPVTGEMGNMRVAVEDTGVGIEKDALEKIFQPFTQQDSIRDTFLHHGNGLGLAIARQLAIRMGGSLEVESTVGQGSRFTLRLENVPYKNGEHRIENTTSLVPVAEEELKIPRDVLLVDDVPLNLSLLSLMLKNLGVQPRLADSGSAALSELEQFTPEVIMTDIWMPDMDGCQLARNIRKKKKLKHTRIVAVTADAEVHVNFDMGAFDAVLLKPLTVSKIKSLFRDLQKKKSSDSSAKEASPAGED